MMRSIRPIRPIRALRTRPRLWGSVFIGGLVFTLLPPEWVSQSMARALIGWNIGALLYLALAGIMMWRGDDAERIQRRALDQDEGQGLVLALVVVASIAVLVAIGSQLAVVKELQGIAKTRHVALAALTLVSAWFFIQVLFTLHYAHEFYLARLRREPDGLMFPGTPDPNYADFFYFACVIGTSAQTADVPFTSSPMRRVGILHCILAFFFNTTVLALTINIAAGLF